MFEEKQDFFFSRLIKSAIEHTAVDDSEKEKKAISHHHPKL